MWRSLRLPRRSLLFDIVLVLVVALVVRVIYLNDLESAPFYHYPIGDSKIYHDRALEIAAGDLVGRDAYFHSSPLYPYFLAAIYRVAGPNLVVVRVIQILIGCSNCLLIYFLTRNLTEKRRGPPLVAGLLAALYGTFVFFDADLLMIPLVLFFGTGSVLLLVSGEGRLRLFVAGLALGLAALGKPNVLLFAPVGLLWILTRLRRTISWQRWPLAMLFAAGVVLTVLPITIRNFIVSQDLVLVSSNAGVNLYIGNHKGANGVFLLPPDSGLDNRELYLSSRTTAEQATGRQPLKPSEVSAYWVERTVDYVRNYPGEWLALMWHKFHLFWNAYEIPNHHNKAFIAVNFSPLLSKLAAGYWLVAPLGVVGMLLAMRRKPSGAARLYVAFLLAYMASLLPFFVTARYRLPVVPFLIAFAAVGAFGLWDLFRARRLRQLALVGVMGLASAAFVSWPLMDFDFGFSHTVMGISHGNMATVDPENGGLHMGRAILDLKKAIELRPREIDAHYNLGTMYQRIGYYSGAATHFEAVVNMQPSHPHAAGALADVRASFEETGNRVESDVIPRTPFEDGGAAVSRNAMMEARAHYEEAIRSDPHHAAAYCGLGTTFFGPGDYETAVSIFERGLAYKSDHFVLNNNIAGAHYRLGNIDKAIRYWGVCLEIDPGNKDVMRQIGVARSRK